MSFDQEVRLQSIPEKPGPRLMEHTASDVCYVACVVIIAFTCITVEQKMAFLAVLSVGLLGWWRFEMGRGYAVFGAALHHLYIITVKKGVLWQPSAGDRRRQLVGRPFKRPAPIGIGITGVQTSEETLGLLSQADKRTDNFIIVGDGSDLVANDLPGQHSLAGDIAEAIKRIAAEVPYQIGVGYVFRRRPFDLPSHQDYILHSYQPDVVVPEALTSTGRELTAREVVDMRMYEHQRQLFGMASLAAGEVTMAAVVTVQQSQNWRAGARRALTLDDIDQAPAAQMARRLAGDLRDMRVVTNARPLSFTEAFRYIRQSWDVVRLGQYYRDCYDGIIPTTDDKVMIDNRGNVISDMQAYPTENITVKGDYCIIDGTYHSTVRIVQCPAAVLPSFFRRLHAINVPWMSIALCGETMSGRRLSVSLTYGISFMRAWDEYRSQTYQTPEQQERRKKLERQHHEQHQSGSVMQDYNILIAVSAASLEELKLNRERLLAGIRQMHKTRGKVIRGASNQLPALLSATTGINQL